MAEGSRYVVCQRTVGKNPLPRYGAVSHGNRLVRIRLLGGVGGGGEKAPATRLAHNNFIKTLYNKIQLIACGFADFLAKSFY